MTKIYCDTSNLKDIKNCIKKYKISGVTTNPSIMRSEGVRKYKEHCIKILKLVKNKPFSIEVFADNDQDIINQAKKISRWGKNIYVKVPVTNTKGKFLKKVIKDLNRKKIKINITAVFTLKQIIDIKKNINKKTPIIVSIFCGRIADLGKDPEPLIARAKIIFKNYKNVQILWASTREVFNYYQAKNCGCDIITMGPTFIEKLKSKKISLNNYSIKTVKQFYLDGKRSKFKI